MFWYFIKKIKERQQRKFSFSFPCYKSIRIYNIFQKNNKIKGKLLIYGKKERKRKTGKIKK